MRSGGEVRIVQPMWIEHQRWVVSSDVGRGAKQRWVDRGDGCCAVAVRAAEEEEKVF